MYRLWGEKARDGLRERKRRSAAGSFEVQMSALI